MREAVPSEFEADLQKMAAYQAEFARYNRRRKAVFRRLFQCYHRLEVSGLENIPDGAALIAANHGGILDLDILALSDFCHPHRPIHVLITVNWHYLNSAWGRYWVGGGIPLWTRGGIRYEYLDPYLQAGGSQFPGLVAIFPEGNSGTFQQRHVLRTFYSGVVRIALCYQVPIVPTATVGFQKACPIFLEIERDHAPSDPVIASLIPFPCKLKVEFGPPFRLERFYGRSLTRAEGNWIANQIVRPRVAEVLARHARTVLADAKVEMKEPA